jgi:hypothetical protein
VSQQPKDEFNDLQKLNVDEPTAAPYVVAIDLLLAELCLPRDWHRALSELLFQK